MHPVFACSISPCSPTLTLPKPSRALRFRRNTGYSLLPFPEPFSLVLIRLCCPFLSHTNAFPGCPVFSRSLSLELHSKLFLQSDNLNCSLPQITVLNFSSTSSIPSFRLAPSPTLLPSDLCRKSPRNFVSENISSFKPL